MFYKKYKSGKECPSIIFAVNIVAFDVNCFLLFAPFPKRLSVIFCLLFKETLPGCSSFVQRNAPGLSAFCLMERSRVARLLPNGTLPGCSPFAQRNAPGLFAFCSKKRIRVACHLPNGTLPKWNKKGYAIFEFANSACQLDY